MTTTTTDAEKAKTEKLINKIRALFAKAASTEHPEEAKVFNDKALELMASNGFTDADLAESGPVAANIVQLGRYGNARYGAVFLYSTVSKMMGGFTLRYQGVKGGSGMFLKVYATPVQFELIQAVCEPLLEQMMRFILRDKPRSRKAYAIGWSIEVGNRLEQAQAVAYSKSTALVPTQTAAMAEATRQDGPWANGTKQRVGGDDCRGGVQAGRETDLGQDRLRRVGELG